ncbi:hypothetical protein A0H81_14850 [Grifola frondosa]|uniref:Uncharacterized protein n=1 Tax=Grifola frondosa TaxID=5627 RepID=A0A1C7LQW3_GRIFR|nr:hypothetical protein A0H81_14850 [Grifola frondosa]
MTGPTAPLRLAGYDTHEGEDARTQAGNARTQAGNTRTQAGNVRMHEGNVPVKFHDFRAPAQRVFAPRDILYVEAVSCVLQPPRLLRNENTSSVDVEPVFLCPQHPENHKKDLTSVSVPSSNQHHETFHPSSPPHRERCP